MSTLEQQLIAEKTLTGIYAALCPECRKKIQQVITDLQLKTADGICAELNISC
jgi:hypothetical protein